MRNQHLLVGLSGRFRSFLSADTTAIYPFSFLLRLGNLTSKPAFVIRVGKMLSDVSSWRQNIAEAGERTKSLAFCQRAIRHALLVGFPNIILRWHLRSLALIIELSNLATPTHIPERPTSGSPGGDHCFVLGYPAGDQRLRSVVGAGTSRLLLLSRLRLREDSFSAPGQGFFYSRLGPGGVCGGLAKVFVGSGNESPGVVRSHRKNDLLFDGTTVLGGDSPDAGQRLAFCPAKY